MVREGSIPWKALLQGKGARSGPLIDFLQKLVSNRDAAPQKAGKTKAFEDDLEFSDIYGKRPDGS